MTLETARELFSSIETTNHEGLRIDFVEKAISYAHIRAKWPLLDIEERRNLDSSRTISHNAFIDSCNILSRNMAHGGEDNSWRARLGDDRKVIGDFACFVALFLGLKAR